MSSLNSRARRACFLVRSVVVIFYLPLKQRMRGWRLDTLSAELPTRAFSNEQSPTSSIMSIGAQFWKRVPHHAIQCDIQIRNEMVFRNKKNVVASDEYGLLKLWRDVPCLRKPWSDDPGLRELWNHAPRLRKLWANGPGLRALESDIRGLAIK